MISTASAIINLLFYVTDTKGVDRVEIRNWHEDEEVFFATVAVEDGIDADPLTGQCTYPSDFINESYVNLENGLNNIEVTVFDRGGNFETQNLNVMMTGFSVDPSVKLHMWNLPSLTVESNITLIFSLVPVMLFGKSFSTCRKIDFPVLDALKKFLWSARADGGVLTSKGAPVASKNSISAGPLWILLFNSPVDSASKPAIASRLDPVLILFP